MVQSSLHLKKTQKITNVMQSPILQSSLCFKTIKKRSKTNVMQDPMLQSPLCFKQIK
jgi:hypothetical protein